jgi:hypothetical protein
MSNLRVKCFLEGRNIINKYSQLDVSNSMYNTFGTINLKTQEDQNFVLSLENKLKSDGYLPCSVFFDGVETKYIIEDLKYTESSKSLTLSGRTATALWDYPYAPLSSPEVEVGDTVLTAVNRLGVPVSFSALNPYINIDDVSLSNYTPVEALKKLSNICRCLLYTDTDGETFIMQNKSYTGSPAVDIPISLITELTTAYNDDVLPYNSVIVEGGSEESLFMKVDTKQLTPSEFEVRVYTSPLIEDFDSITYDTTDGSITLVDTFVLEEKEDILNFSSSEAVTSYPIHTVSSIQWFSNHNNSDLEVIEQGTRTIRFKPTTLRSDMGLALIKYYTECNVYKVTGLTEQEIKLKFEGEYNG